MVYMIKKVGIIIMTNAVFLAYKLEEITKCLK